MGHRLPGFYDPADRARFGVVPVTGPGVPAAQQALAPEAASIAAEIHAWQLSRSAGSAPSPGAASPAVVAETLARLDDLRRSGAINESQFEAQKRRLLA